MPVRLPGNANSEIAAFIDGTRTVLDIYNAVRAECGHLVVGDEDTKFAYVLSPTAPDLSLSAVVAVIQNLEKSGVGRDLEAHADTGSETEEVTDPVDSPSADGGADSATHDDWPGGRRPWHRLLYWLPVVLTVVLVARLAWREMRAPDSAPAGPIILVSIDSLRADRLSAYGYDGNHTPAIDSLVSDGVLFERAFAHVPLTLPSHVTILSGLLPFEHGVRDDWASRSDPE